MKVDLEAAGFQVLAEEAYVSASASLSTHASRLDLLVVDLYLPERQRSSEKPNLGWRLLAESQQSLPSWCELVVCTAYGETRPAADALKVMFIEKMTGDYDEKFLPFASEWARTCQTRLNETDSSYPGVPVVNVDSISGGLDYESLMMCRAITDAKRVEVLRRLSGSLQEAPVLQVRLTPKGDAPDCYAVVKRGYKDETSTDGKPIKGKAVKEIEGQSKLMWYWGEIGRSIPPLRNYPSLLSSRELILVTPFARGRTLAEVASERWYDDKHGRVRLFQGIFEAVGRFLETINHTRSCEHGVDYVFTNAYLTGDPESVRRRTKTVPALEALIGTSGSVLTCAGSSVTVANPLMLFSHEEGAGWHWQRVDPACGIATYGHGDFHVGNVMVDLSTDGTLNYDGLTVLDYDYVGEYCLYYDRAQLESSFLVELALTFEEKCQTTDWDGYFLPALRVLTSARTEASIENNKFAYDLVSVSKTLRGDLKGSALKLYYGALFTTLLRISVSKYQKAHGKLTESAKRTIVVTLGLLLNQLVEWEEKANRPLPVSVPF